MKLLRKQYNRQYKNRHYFYYTRRIWFGRFAEKWKFWGYTTSGEAAKANLTLEASGYEYPENGSWK